MKFAEITRLEKLQLLLIDKQQIPSGFGQRATFRTDCRCGLPTHRFRSLRLQCWVDSVGRFLQGNNSKCKERPRAQYTEWNLLRHLDQTPVHTSNTKRVNRDKRHKQAKRIINGVTEPIKYYTIKRKNLIQLPAFILRRVLLFWGIRHQIKSKGQPNNIGESKRPTITHVNKQCTSMV